MSNLHNNSRRFAGRRDETNGEDIELRTNLAAGSEAQAEDRSTHQTERARLRSWRKEPANLTAGEYRAVNIQVGLVRRDSSKERRFG